MSIAAANRAFCAVSSAELTRRLAGVMGQSFQGRLPDGTILGGTAYTAYGNILPYGFNGNTVINSLTISPDVVAIGDYAFIGASALRTIINRSERLNP